MSVVADGSEAASTEPFEAFYRREYRPVVGLGYALCGDRGAAEDLAQDAFVAAQLEWSRLQAYDRPGAWVRRAVANRAVSLRRRRSAEQRALQRWFTRRDPRDAGDAFLSPETDEFWHQVRALPPRQSQIVALHYLDDRPVSEIASILDCAEGTVKAQLHKARAALARRLDLEEVQG
jgi:RNA polymerase sigma-70 factor (ECF subfamily)